MILHMLLKEIREELIEFGNHLLEEKLVHDMQGNISVMDTATGFIVITPSAIPYRLRKPEDICVLDTELNVIEGGKKPTSELALHTTLYRHRKDIKAIIHTHPIHTCVFAVAHEPIPQILSEVTMGFIGDVPLAPYAEPGTQKLADIVYKTMGENKVSCILAHHGLVTVSDNLSKSLQITLAIEDAANINIMVRSMGAKVHLINGA